MKIKKTYETELIINKRKADLEEETPEPVVTEESWENQEDTSELVKCDRRESGESNQDS